RGYAREVSEGRVEERRASHILLLLDELASDRDVAAARDKLRHIRERILAGEVTFEDMAKEHSSDPTGAGGGDLGWFSKGSLDPSFEAAVWSMKEGQISEPVRTPFGLHLVRTSSIRSKELKDPSQKEQMMQQIRYRLRETEMKRLYGQWLQTLREEAFIEIRQ
ncbi:MAG: peptidylprolyl isomerase, partial [Myxococcota bacterium]|nr:peptidylprolyl isomerase [Myxococcota bacterium]